MDTDVELGKGEGCETSPGCSGYSSMVHSKKVIKHALRQQAKRRRKNTTIAAGNSRTLPRIVVKPLPPPPPNDPPSPVNNVQHINTTSEEPAATMREVLASLPGFSVKSGRRRSTKRLSATAQLEAGLVDLESPASILASTSLRALLNRHTFQGLPPLYQRKLAQLLPAVDRQDAATSGLNNEFFARACLEWRKRLAEGEFTPENQQRLKMEAERDKNKLDPWKVKHFEPIWGEKREPKLRSGLHCMESRSGGAVTRSSLRLRLESNADTHVSGTPCPIVMSEVKVEQDNCKVETNSTDDLNETNTEIRELLPTEYNETTRASIDEKRIESADVSSVETIPDVEMDRVKFEVDDKVVDLPAKERATEDGEAVARVRQGTILNSYEEDIDLPRDQKSLKVFQVDDKVIDLPMTETTIDESGSVAQVCQETISNSYSNEEDADLARDKKDLESLRGSKEDAILLPEENTSPTPSEQTERMSQASSQLSTDCSSQTSAEHTAQIATERMSQMSEEQIYSMSDCETTTILETSPSHEQVRSTDIVMEDSTLINDDRTEVTQASRETPTDGESQIPEGMEIDIETLQRIHELEVRGEMREAYEEISGCPEEIIYPILDGIEMGSNNTEETETPVVPGQSEGIPARDQQDVNSGNEDEALRDANNYVCSEMLECSWSVDPTVNNVTSDNRTQEDLQVPWPLVAALDGSVATNIPMPPQDECSETPSSTNSANPPPPPPPPPPNPPSQQFINADSNVEPVNCIQLPVVQGTPFQSEGLAIGAPSTSCIMKNFQPQNSSLIAFPQLQPIGFVQTSFQSGQNAAPALSTTSAITGQVATTQNASSQAMKPQEEAVQMNAQSNNPRPIRSNAAQNQVPNAVPAAIGVQPQNRPQNAIVIQHQSPAPTQPRQVVPAMQQQQFPGTTVAVSTRSSRSANQGNQRNSRSSNKDQGSGRSRSTTKEPPGAVNLERSYQICQAVIQSSPNRDQLKAHLKPPPSLLARGDGAFTTNKSGGRTITTVKTTKTSQTIQTKQIQSKTQSVMLRHVFATTRQATSAEIPESNTVAQLGSTTTGGLGQYILVQRTGVGDSAPRASSAPPLPPQIAGMGVGIHLVRGRPASAGEGSHQAVTLKARGTDGRGGGGAEPGAPGMIMGGDPPPPCDCNMRGAMVICRQCGAFCHDDCIGPQRICATCLIR